MEKAPPYQSTEASSYTGTSQFRTAFASVSLHMTDRIRLLQFPSEVVSGVRQAIQASWYKGIQQERTYSLSHEFKVCGRPWYGQTSDAIPSRLLMRAIFAYLHSIGWILTMATDVSKSTCDKDTLIFRKQPRSPPPSAWIAISFNRGDRLRLIGAEEDLIAAFRQLLSGMHVLQDQSWKDPANNAYEFKLYGTPWLAAGEATMITRVLLLKMVELLENYGWSVYASVDQNTASKDSSETDTWYCVKAEDWVPGAPVLHR